MGVPFLVLTHQKPILEVLLYRMILYALNNQNRLNGQIRRYAHIQTASLLLVAFMVALRTKIKKEVSKTA